MRWVRCLAILAMGGAASGGDLVISGGLGPSTTSTVGSPAGDSVTAKSTGIVMLNLGGNFFNFGVLALGYEVPVVVGGPGRAFADTRGSGGATYTERANLFITPGVRLRVLPVAPFTPWVSAGPGLGRLQRTGALYNLTAQGIRATATQTGDRRVFALSVAGGVDWKPAPLLLIRAEVRNFTFTTPETALVGSYPFTGGRRNNLTFLGGIGIRF